MHTHTRIHIYIWMYDWPLVKCHCSLRSCQMLHTRATERSEDSFTHAVIICLGIETQNIGLRKARLGPNPDGFLQLPPPHSLDGDLLPDPPHRRLHSSFNGQPGSHSQRTPLPPHQPPPSTCSALLLCLFCGPICPHHPHPAQSAVNRNIMSLLWRSKSSTSNDTHTHTHTKVANVPIFSNLLTSIRTH